MTKKKQEEEVDPHLLPPLVHAKSLALALNEKTNIFSHREQENLVTYAIVGCSQTVEEGFKKYGYTARKVDSKGEIINLDLFLKSLPLVVDLLQKAKEEELLLA